MDDYTAKQLLRIEKKLDGIFGLVAGGIFFFGIPWASSELQKNYGLGEGWSYGVAFAVFAVAIGWLARGIEGE